MLLDALELGRYHATGAYHPVGGPNTGLPLEWDGTLAREGRHLILRGEYRHHVGAPGHPFALSIELPPGILERSTFELQCPHLSNASGAVRALGGGIVFGGRDAQSGASISLNVEVLKPGVLDGKGTVVFSDGSVWLYHFEMLPADSRLSKAEVVGIHARQR